MTLGVGCHNDIRLTPWVSAVFMSPLELDVTLGSERLTDLKANKEVKKSKEIISEKK